MGAPPPATPSQHTYQHLRKVMQAWGQVHNTLTSAISMHNPVPSASLPLCLTCNRTLLGVGVFVCKQNMGMEVVAAFYGTPPRCSYATHFMKESRMSGVLCAIHMGIRMA